MWQGLESGQVGFAVSQLTEKLKLDTGTVTPLLKRMEAKDLLNRKRSEQDERIVLVSLTASGIALREAAKHIPQTLLCQGDADANKVIQLRETLKSMLHALS
jgi:DNA-binding MarR family transcriptional regulator